MTRFETPFTHSELQSLDQFLRNRTGAKTDLNLTHAHGFLSAVLTAPLLCHANYNSLLMDKSADAEHQTICANEHNPELTRLVSQIDFDLQRSHLSPLLFENTSFGYEGGSWELLQKWCSGYLQGVFLDSLWARDEHGLMLTMPMGILAGKLDLVGFPDSHGETIVDNLSHKILAREHLLSTIATLYTYWEKQRSIPKEQHQHLH